MGHMPLAWQLVRVAGPSMVPTLHDGDIVLARFRALPDRFVVKRTVRPESGGWLLGSDNEAAGGDSRSHGVADVFGRVVLRWPGGRRTRLPRRLRRGSGHLPGRGSAVTDSTNR